MISRTFGCALVALAFSIPAAHGFEFAPLKPIDLAAVSPEMLTDIYGAWEIRDRAGRKRCRVVLARETAIGGSAIEVAQTCAKAFPVMGDIAAWRLQQSWTIDLVDALRKTRVRFQTPDERYIAIGDPTDIAGMGELRKLPAAGPAKRR